MSRRTVILRKKLDQYQKPHSPKQGAGMPRIRVFQRAGADDAKRAITPVNAGPGFATQLKRAYTPSKS